MAGGELQPKPGFLIGRSAEIAHQAEGKVRELLGRHLDIVSPGIVNIIAQREAASARQDYEQKRQEGRANDNYSQKPGITIYLTGEAKHILVEVLEESGRHIPEEHVEQTSENVWKLRFPRGVYNMGFGGASFYEEAAEDWERTNEAEKPFSMPYDAVVRIEGDNDELWQNVHYNWDGTLKNQNVR